MKPSDIEKILKKIEAIRPENVIDKEAIVKKAVEERTALLKIIEDGENETQT